MDKYVIKIVPFPGSAIKKVVHDKSTPMDLATHCITFLVCGIKSRWKQVIAYEFTSNSFDANEVAEYIKRLLKLLFDIGLKPRNVTMDMGPGNIPV